MTFRMIVQLWNTNTSVFVSCDADLTENYLYISMKFGTGVHVFCWEVGVFNRSSFQSVSYKCAMTFRMIAQLWNTNTAVIVSFDADLTENYMYISMKFRTGVHVFCWEVGVFNRSCFQSVSCKAIIAVTLVVTDFMTNVPKWFYCMGSRYNINLFK